MKIIFLKDIPQVGRKNEVKDVSDGYARNFLFPRNLAKPATADALKNLTVQKTHEEEEKSVEQKKQEAFMEKLKSITLTFKVKIGEKGRAFGSVTPLKISKELEKHGIKIEKESVELEESIKTTGEHAVKIKFPQGFSGEVKILVEGE